MSDVIINVDPEDVPVVTVTVDENSAQAAIDAAAALTIILNELRGSDFSLLSEKLERGGYPGTAEDLRLMIVSILTDSTMVNGVTPTSSIPVTGNIHALVTEQGTYANWNNLEVATNSLAILMRIDGVYSISQTALNLAEYQKTAELFDYSIGKNKFDKTKKISGFYIGGDGNIYVNAPSIISDWIPIDATKKYYIQGRTTTGMRFRNASGALLQPFNSSGVAVTNWSSSENGIVYPPTGAVDIQFTTTLGGAGDINTVQLEEGMVGTVYEPYSTSQLLKVAMIPNLPAYVKPTDLVAYPKTVDLFDDVANKNKFDKTTVISGYYIGSGDGSLQPNSPSKISAWMPIDATKKYYLVGRTTAGMRFRNSAGTLLQPFNSSGVAVTNWSSPDNGIVYPPTGAIEMQMTITLSGNGDINTVQLEEGSVGTAYESYSTSQVLKQAMIPKLNAYATVSDLALKASLTDLTERVNLFDKTNVVEGKYVSTTTGALSDDATSAVSAIIPVTGGRYYYLQGKTTDSKDIVFYDVNGTKLKPYDGFGVQRNTFDLPTIESALMSPPTAVSVQFTIKFVGSGSYEAIMFSQNSVAQTYASYSTTFIKPELIKPTQSVVLGDFKVTKSINTIAYRTSFDSLHDVYVTLSNGAYLNRLYNINSAKLLLKTENTDVAGIPLNGVGGDDSAPSFFNGVILGGNHGAPSHRITANGHGKTLADVGAKYTDANAKEFTIIQIIDANTILLGVKNTSVITTWSFPNPVTPLTYLSNGNSTTAVNFTASASEQLYPSVKNVNHKLIVDGIEKSENTTHYGNKVNIIETYDIIDYPDMLAKLTTNRPTGGYLTQPLFTNGDAIVTITNIFNVQPKGLIALVNTFEIIKAIDFNYFAITQNGFVTPNWATTVRRYFPKTLPIVNNGNTFDFRLKPEFKTPVITNYFYISPDLWENSKPVNRVVDLLESAGLNVNFNLGYLPLGGNRSDMVNNAWEMVGTKKLYPHYIDGKTGTANIVPLGTVKQGVAFRGWSKPSGIRTNDFLVENGGKHYLYLDYHTIGTDTVELPSYLLGKTVTVIDKSANVELITSIVTGNIKVKITTSTPMYGYCELLIQ